MTALANITSYMDATFAPVTDERTDVALPVIGQLPSELSGVLVNNSPNPALDPGPSYHWFDGDGMVHAIHFDGGRATYRNRYIHTAGLDAERAAGQRLWRGLLEPFDPTCPRGPDKNTANTDLVWHNGKLLALWWLGGEPYTLSLPDLETIGAEDFGGTLTCGIAAHPKVCPSTGEMIFFDYSPYRPPHLQVGVASADGRVTHHLPIHEARPSLFHDIAITRNHTILLDLPMLWDPSKLAQGKRRVRFARDQPGRIGVMERHGDRVRWFEIPPCYSYHTINAHETQDAAGDTVITLIACRIEDPIPTTPHAAEPHIPRLHFLRLQPFLHRWTINLGTGQVTEEQLDDVPTEFPRMNDRFLGGPARLAWSPRVARSPTLLFDGFITYDLQTGSGTATDYGEGMVGGETVFAPRAGGTDEDDGWVVVFVNEASGARSEARVYDARQPGSPPVARVQIPRRVPTGFHAHWVPGEEISGGAA